MKTTQKALVWVLLTYASGVASGMLLNGAMIRRRLDAERGGPPPQGAPRGERQGAPRGFVELVEEQIRPRDDAQRAALRPRLEAADARNRAIVDGARGEMGRVMAELIDSVAPLLDSAQLARVRAVGREGGRDAGGGLPGDGRGRGRGGPGGPRGGPPGLGGPPPGRGGPGRGGPPEN